jgi:hypothetical protein
MADKNGDGIVYHCSDCGDDNVRMYLAGGDWPGSACETWGLTSTAIRYVHDHPEMNHRLEDLLAMEIAPIIAPIGEFIEEGYEKVKEGVIDAYHWVDENGCNIAVTAAISAGVIAYFTPAQPAGAATSTTLSIMAQPLLYVADMATKAVAVAAMSEIITEGFLLIPFVSESIDHTLLKNIISNCLAKSLDSAALWATPAGVGIAIGAAVAPVIADLICKKTCPEGFTKAFNA